MCDEEENVVIKGEGAMRSSISTKRSRAAAIHNESERKRRDRINQKMKTLQKLVPNSSKADKASMLDEVINYLKQLQAQVQVMSRMSSMMMPMGMAMPQLQMSVMAQMAQMAQFGLSMMNMGHQSGYPGLTPPMMHTPPFHLPVSSWDATAAGDRPPLQPIAGAAASDPFSAFLAAQQNAQQPPNSMEAYNRMMAMYQKLNQQQDQPSNSRHAPTQIGQESDDFSLCNSTEVAGPFVYTRRRTCRGPRGNSSILGDVLQMGKEKGKRKAPANVTVSAIHPKYMSYP
uniref:BHLH domain-containing protein n=1 Tax=Leersia perrieri TaxID=77586 RepID=A0A0D9XMB4_9ORYZ